MQREPNESPWRRLIGELLHDDRAQDTIEYAFLAAFIGVAGWVAVNTIAPAVGTTYSSWIDPNSGAPALWQPCEPGVPSGQPLACN